MKKTGCEEVKLRISGNDALTPQDLDHLRSCPDCRDFQTFAQRVTARTADDDRAIPEETDTAVRQYAFRKAGENMRNRKTLFRILLPAAASLVLCAGITLFALSSRKVRPPERVRQTAGIQTADSSAWTGDGEENLIRMTCEMGDSLNEMERCMDEMKTGMDLAML